MRCDTARISSARKIVAILQLIKCISDEQLFNVECFALEGNRVHPCGTEDLRHYTCTDILASQPQYHFLCGINIQVNIWRKLKLNRLLAIILATAFLGATTCVFADEGQPPAKKIGIKITHAVIKLTSALIIRTSVSTKK
jgi:hypothetical protein